MVKNLKLSLFFIGMMLIVSSCTFVRFFVWNYADINDNHKFQNVPVHKGNTTFSFYSASKNLIITPVSDKYKTVFEDFLKDNKTLAFLIIRNDSLVYENYFDGYNALEPIPSFSISKSVVSALTGIAIAEGKIKDTKQVVTDFLPWMTSPGFDKVRIEDLLNMRSGIDLEETYNSPFFAMPKYYYGRHLVRYLKHLKISSPPDHHYKYESVNTLLLGLILEKATGMPLNQYLEEKLWKPMGMESIASWSIDSKKWKTIKSFCCLNVIARDYARFGRLYLQKGAWEGKQLVPESWVEKSMSVINDSKEGQGYSYTYCWRITPKGAIFAKGILGQYIYVLPKKNVVMVRLGRDTGNINWAALFEKMEDQL